MEVSCDESIKESMLSSGLTEIYENTNGGFFLEVVDEDGQQ